MSKKKIQLEEQKEIQLEMLIEIDAFCRKNGIKYSLAYGTLIGAIRHKGFIPWDDDVDLIMPINDLIRFKNEFHSPNIEYVDIDSCKYYEYSFPRLAHKATYSQKGKCLRTYGVNIDLYPIVPIPSDRKERMQFFRRVKIWYYIRLWILRLNKRLTKYLPIKGCGLLDFSVKQLTKIQFSYKKASTGWFYCISGPYSMKDRLIYQEDLFETITDVEFEGHKFCAIAVYDKWLRDFYGDYMQLPPEKERYPYHGGHYFWKNKKDGE